MLARLTIVRGLLANAGVLLSLADSVSSYAGTVTVSGSLTSQGAGNFCVYSAMAEDNQGNWTVTCGGTGFKTVTFSPSLFGQACSSVSGLAEDGNGNWTVSNCVSAAVPATLYYVHTDNIGTPRLITKSSDSSVVWRWDNTEPFGLGSANETVSGSPFSYGLRFAGQSFDAEAGTHYNYFRDYDPSIGRYIESDPMGLAADISTYAYVGSKPVDFADPRGLMGRGSGPRPLGYTPKPPPGNGNLMPGFDPQDMVCSLPMININRCVTSCCATHDNCFEVYGCNWSSWAGYSGSHCQSCNREAARCIMSTALNCPTGCPPIDYESPRAPSPQSGRRY